MNLPKLVIFDMDGLIFDTERLFFSVLKEVMAERGYVLTEEDYQVTIGRSLADVIVIRRELYGEDFPCEELDSIAHRRISEWAKTHPIPVRLGIPQLLAFLKERGIPCCVASASAPEVISFYLESSGLASYFSFVMSGTQIPHAKPNPEIFLRCTKQFGISPAEALVLEDSPSGVQAALRGNIPVICIPDMIRPEEALLEKTLLVAKDAEEVIAAFSD